jgi:HlyD family secretion protein
MDRAVPTPSRRGARLAVAGGVGGLLLLLLLALPALRRWSSAEATVEASRIQVATVTRGDLVRDVLGDGRVVAARHPTLFSPAAGIATVVAKAGAAVKEGEVLARIESPELLSRLAQERSTLAALSSALGRQRLAARQDALRNGKAIALLEVKRQAADREAARAKRTFDEGVLNAIEYEKARDELRIAEVELANARDEARLEEEAAAFETRDRELAAERQNALVTELARQADLLTVRAPFQGLVASVAVQASLAENEALDVVAGTPAVVVADGRELAARVTAVSPEVKDGAVKATVAFDGESPAGLRQSQRVRVRLLLDTRKGVLKLPRGPFLQTAGGRTAWVVADGAARARTIRVGAFSVAEVEVVEGLREGERVIVSDTSEFAGARTVLVRK